MSQDDECPVMFSGTACEEFWMDMSWFAALFYGFRALYVVCYCVFGAWIVLSIQRILLRSQPAPSRIGLWALTLLGVVLLSMTLESVLSIAVGQQRHFWLHRGSP